MSVIHALGRPSQKDWKFKASLGSRMRLFKNQNQKSKQKQLVQLGLCLGPGDLLLGELKGPGSLPRIVQSQNSWMDLLVGCWAILCLASLTEWLGGNLKLL